MVKVAKHKRRRQRGSAMLELSFIFLVFLGLLIGTFDFGQFLFIHQALVERARYAARWGLAQGSPVSVDSTTRTNDQVKNMVIYGQSTAGTTGYFGLDSTMVTVSTSGSGTWDNSMSILISNYPYKMLAPYIAGSYTGPNISVTIPFGLFD
jgi:Flp pilus assembly protein TadG